MSIARLPAAFKKALLVSVLGVATILMLPADAFAECIGGNYGVCESICYDTEYQCRLGCWYAEDLPTCIDSCLDNYLSCEANCSWNCQISP